ncbi:GNAT family N-acetyltransferase [Nocardia sp. alder85J]|uniref:GNAT family N-acetyltransferase n=1 Tax=Nocardia sp. alder85J TaxID=2862949 RepID=UPI001CD1D1B1|nr:N-acetyltransferase [Nocardia sp. alder85J]MCX4098247.1 N-acetyltransferase [Nocardia sp. alder85J]
MTPHAIPLGPADAGEILTLQRAAYVTEARAHGDLSLPPLTQTLPELLDELARPQVLGFGVRAAARLVAAVRIRVDGTVGHLGRLTVAPDLHGQGLGSALLTAVETRLPAGITELRLFTGEHSPANLRLYHRFGYRETGRTPVPGYRLVHLVKALPGR